MPPFVRAAMHGPVAPTARAAALLSAASLLMLASGCGSNGNGNDSGPPPIAASVGLSPAATVSRSGSLVLQQQDRSTSAGAQVSQSPRYTLINEGVTP